MKKPTLRSALLAAVVLAGASLGSTAAQAQVIGNSPQALDLVDDSAFFGDSLEAGNSGATFADRFTFTVDEALGVNVDAIVGSVSRSADVGLDITGLWIYDGNVVSGEGASFGGAIMLAPVPEPETYGMMLGGLGILGFLARRRQAKRG